MSDDEPADLMGLLERVAVRLAHEGAPHPVAAATALTARGHEGVDQSDFASAHGLDPAVVDAAESGTVPLNELPEPVLVIVVDHPGLDLVEIERLDVQLRPFASGRPFAEGLLALRMIELPDDDDPS